MAKLGKLLLPPVSGVERRGGGRRGCGQVGGGGCSWTIINIRWRSLEAANGRGRGRGGECERDFLTNYARKIKWENSAAAAAGAAAENMWPRAAAGVGDVDGDGDVAGPVVRAGAGAGARRQLSCRSSLFLIPRSRSIQQQQQQQQTAQH